MPDNMTSAEARANHWGQYQYSAYINKNRLYSNYVFKADSIGRYRLYGYEMFQRDKYYGVAMVNNTTKRKVSHTVAAYDHKFDYDYSNCKNIVGEMAYFYIDGTGFNTEVSIAGFLDTY